MIKHLAPRTEDEINEMKRTEIASVAFRKLAEYDWKDDNTIRSSFAANSVIVYVSGFELEFNKDLLSNSYYEVKFRRSNNRWELANISTINSMYMNKSWYTTQYLSAGNPMKRPYDD